MAILLIVLKKEHDNHHHLAGGIGLGGSLDSYRTPATSPFPVTHPCRPWRNTLWLLALILHGSLLLRPWLETHSVSLDLLSSLSIVMWFTSFLLFLTHLTRPLETMGLLVIPFTLLSLLVANFLPHAVEVVTLQTGLSPCVILSLLAYSMLALATLQKAPAVGHPESPPAQPSTQWFHPHPAAITGTWSPCCFS
ncbi:MAG: hypothetical protein R3E89_12410 [Thiolinea sp.]